MRAAEPQEVLPRILSQLQRLTALRATEPQNSDRICFTPSNVTMDKLEACPTSEVELKTQLNIATRRRSANGTERWIAHRGLRGCEVVEICVVECIEEIRLELHPDCFRNAEFLAK